MSGFASATSTGKASKSARNPFRSAFDASVVRIWRSI
jgi:hypothetical protein